MGSRSAEFRRGRSLQAHFRLLFTHKGHISYVMQAGMGDIVFAPLYLVLKDRGVKFDFFQRVRKIGLSSDGKHIKLSVLRCKNTREGILTCRCVPSTDCRSGPVNHPSRE